MGPEQMAVQIIIANDKNETQSLTLLGYFVKYTLEIFFVKLCPF